MPVNDALIDLFVLTMAKKTLNLNATDNIIALYILTVQKRCRPPRLNRLEIFSQ